MLSDIIADSERIFLCTEGDSSKFWRVRVEGSIQAVCYGRIGTDGHELIKTFDSSVAATKATDKLIAEKLGKGYRQVSAGEATAAHETARATTGERDVTATRASRKPRKARKPQTLPWQQLLLSFDEEESKEAGAVVETPMAMPHEPAPISLGRDRDEL
nr:WGR domain-containing protein [Armatimonas sp.]